MCIRDRAGGDELEKFHAVKVDPENRQQNISEPFEIESYTKFTFPGRGEKYSNFKWNFQCFSGVDFAEGQENGIYQIINDHGDGWEEVVDDEKGNYDYLMYNDCLLYTSVVECMELLQRQVMKPENLAFVLRCPEKLRSRNVRI